MLDYGIFIKYNKESKCKKKVLKKNGLYFLRQQIMHIVEFFNI